MPPQQAMPVDVAPAAEAPITSGDAPTVDKRMTNGSSKSAKPAFLAGKRKSTLKERGEVPPSIYLLWTSVVVFLVNGDIFTQEVWDSYQASMSFSFSTIVNGVMNLHEMVMEALDGQYRHPKEYLTTGITALFVASLVYVFFLAPLFAGFWTSPTRVTKQVVHRFMGLLYLLQYGAAWTEYFYSYETAQFSYLPHFISLNGLIQGTSAYFSFKVLPEMIDAGYYSDKSVLSRTFVHENLYFTFMAYVGSGIYNKALNEKLMSTLGGQALIYVFTFFPYTLVRIWFPTTQFSKAGSNMSGRSQTYEKFYRYATTTVKIFYLWAKYFCGFYINFLCFLGIHSPEDLRFIQGLYLLNAGTISLAVFLHTLRFRKVLPPVFTFSVYLAQIYLTFSAIPLAFPMFASHKMLCALCLSGIAVNMTRRRELHYVWSVVAFILITQAGIEW